MKYYYELTEEMIIEMDEHPVYHGPSLEVFKEYDCKWLVIPATGSFYVYGSKEMTDEEILKKGNSYYFDRGIIFKND